MKLTIKAVSAVSGIACLLYYFLKRKKHASNQTGVVSDMNNTIKMQTIVEETVDSLASKVVSENSKNCEGLMSSCQNTDVCDLKLGVPQNIEKCIVDESPSVDMKQNLDPKSLVEVDLIECDPPCEESNAPTFPKSPMLEKKRSPKSPHEQSVSESSDTTSVSEIIDSSQEDDSAVDLRCSSSSSKATIPSRKIRKRKSRKVLNLWQSDNDREESCSPPVSTYAVCPQEFVMDIIDYEFRIPSNFVGKFIGREGQSINSLMTQTDTVIVIEGLPKNGQTCKITGYRGDVNSALQIIKKRYPRFDTEHVGDLIPAPRPLVLTHIFQLRQTELTRVALHHVEDPADVSVGFLDHPSYSLFVSMKSHMDTFYKEAPIPSPEDLVVNTYAIYKQDDDSSHRVRIIKTEGEVVTFELVDWGATMSTSVDCLRLIAKEHLSVELQSHKVHINGIMPFDGISWYKEAKDQLESMREMEFYIRMLGWSHKQRPVLEFFFISADRQFVYLKDYLASLNLVKDTAMAC